MQALVADAGGAWGRAQGRAGGVQAKLRQDLQPTLVANWKVWVPFQLLNFRFVPPSLQARARPPGAA
jgi:hypothetical protein